LTNRLLVALTYKHPKYFSPSYFHTKINNALQLHQFNQHFKKQFVKQL